MLSQQALHLCSRRLKPSSQAPCWHREDEVPSHHAISADPGWPNGISWSETAAVKANWGDDVHPARMAVRATGMGALISKSSPCSSTSNTAAASSEVITPSVTARTASLLSLVDDSSSGDNAQSSPWGSSPQPCCRYSSARSRNTSLEMIPTSLQRRAILYCPIPNCRLSSPSSYQDSVLRFRPS